MPVSDRRSLSVLKSLLIAGGLGGCAFLQAELALTPRIASVVSGGDVAIKARNASGVPIEGAGEVLEADGGTLTTDVANRTIIFHAPVTDVPRKCHVRIFDTADRGSWGTVEIVVRPVIPGLPDQIAQSLMPGIMGHEWIGPEPTSNLIAGEVHHMSQPVRSKARPDRPRTRFRKITALACAFMVKEDFGTEAEGSQLRTAFARATDPQGTLRLIVTDERSLSFVDPASGKVQVLMGDGRKKYKLARERGYKYFGVTQIAWTPGGFDNPSLPYRGVLVETYRSRDGLLQSVVGAFDEKRGFQHFVGTLGRTGQGTMFRNGGREARPMFGQITGLAMAENGTVYVADETNEMIRRVTPDGTVSTLAGLEPVPGAPRASIDGPATTARFASLSGMALDPATGDLYVADAFKIRRVTQAGVVTTLYDDGRPGTRVKVFFDWGMVPSSRALPGLKGLADHAVLRFFNGNLFVLDKTSSRITVCRLADRTCRALVGAGHPAMARLNRPLPYFSPGLDEQEYTQLRNASDMIITPTGKCVVTLDYGIVQLDLGALGDPAAAAPAPAAGAGAAAAPAAPVPPAGAGAGAAPERESKDEVPRL